MTQIAANKPAPDITGLQDAQWQARLDRIAHDPRMSKENTTLSPSGARKVAMGFILVGLAGLLVTIIGAFSFNLRHALGAFEIGVFTALAISLGSLFWVMVFHSLNAGWPITIRRQFENLASMIWVPLVMMMIIAGIEITQGGVLLKWLTHSDEYNHLLEAKEPYLNAKFFVIRIAVYAAIWILITQTLLRWSKKSDETGDRTLGRKARKLSGFGLPVFALTTAFASFDFLMSLDYRFFSTMWGVYYFASAGLASASAVAVVVYLLRRAGKLEGLVTDEHFHDLGKLIFTFTVFWAYIAFSQYFLIWYSNIPEETAWFTNRTQHGWQWLFFIMTIGHFLVPFFLLIWRNTKRTPAILFLMAIYMLLMTVMDMTWIIRPMVDIQSSALESPSGAGITSMLIDISGVVGALGIFGGLVALKVAKSPLLPLKDPMLHESLKHKNFV